MRKGASPAAVAVRWWMMVAGRQTLPPPSLALTATAMQRLTRGGNLRCSLPCCHLEGPPSSVVIIVVIAAIVNVIEIVVIVDVLCPLPFRRPKLIVDCVHHDTVAPLLPPSAFVVILSPLQFLPPVVRWRCVRSPLVGRRRGRSPPSRDFAVAPPSLQSILEWGR